MNNIINNNLPITTGKDSKAPEELLADPQAYEQFLATLQQGIEKLDTQLTDGLQDKRENTKLMQNLQQEINLFMEQFDDYMEQAQSPDSPASPPVMVTQLQALMSEIYPELEVFISPLKAMQDKIKETNTQLENNLITPKEAQSLLNQAQQLVNDTMYQIDHLLKKSTPSVVNNQAKVTLSTPTNSSGIENPSVESNVLTTTSVTQSNGLLQEGSPELSETTYNGGSDQYVFNFVSLNDNYSMFLLAFWLFSEMADVSSDSSALVANLLSMNTGYADQTNDDMMAYVAMQAVIPYEYTDANGNKVTTDDAYLIYSIMAISTPGNDSYDPESVYFDQDLAQQGAGFYTYMQEHHPEIEVFDPTEISTALNVYDNTNTAAVCEAYNDMAKAMEELNENIKYCATHLESNEPVLDFPETEKKPASSSAYSYTIVSLDDDVLNQNSDTMTSLQSLATQLAEDLQMQLEALLETLQECYKSAKSEISAYGSVSGAIATGQ